MLETRLDGRLVVFRLETPEEEPTSEQIAQYETIEAQVYNDQVDMPYAVESLYSWLLARIDAGLVRPRSAGSSGPP